MRFRYRRWLLLVVILLVVMQRRVYADDDDDDDDDDYDYDYGEAEASPAPSPFVAPAPSRGVVFLSPPDANDTKGNGNKDGLGSQDWTLDVVSPEGLLLMDVVYRTTNWNEATKSVPRWYGWNWPDSSPCIGKQTWSGVLCRGPVVIEVNLRGLGLKGMLSPDVLKIPNLEALDLSDNGFEGYLPPQWSSRTLKRLELSKNKLTGELPAAYGSKQTFPSLTRMSLDGNDLTGRLPGSEWLSNGFAPQAVITIRPGNDYLCGAVPVVDPKYYGTMPDGEDFRNIEGPTVVSLDSAFVTNTSQVYLVYRNLFAMTPHIGYTESASQGLFGRRRRTASIEDSLERIYIRSSDSLRYTNPTNVVITNTLGTCPTPCGETESLPSSNLLEAAWSFNVTLKDLLRYNSGLQAGNALPGEGVALPCYNDMLIPYKSGSDVAQGMFAGGNQRSVVGTVGAEIAGAVVRGEGLPIENGIFFEGIMDWEWEGNGMKAVRVEPVYWFVDLGTEYTVSGISIRSGDPMYNISVYVGSNKDNIFANDLVASELAFEAGQTLIVPVQYVQGSFVVLYAASRPIMSLSNVKVWSAESNIAAGKTILASENTVAGNITELGRGFMVDGNIRTCTRLSGAGGAGFSFAIDTGYMGNIESVMLSLKGSAIQSGYSNAEATVFVSDSQNIDDLSLVNICGELQVPPGRMQKGVTCNQYGRYIGVFFESLNSTNVCEFDVYLSSLDPIVDDYGAITVQSSDIVGIAVGSALGGALFATILLLIVVLWRKKKKTRRIAANKDLYHDAEKGIVGFRKDSLTSNSGDSMSPRKIGVEAYEIGNSSREQSQESPTKAGRIDSMTSRSCDLANLTSTFDIIDFTDIELVKTIGEGSYGLVWLGRYLQTTVAVKVLTHDSKRAMGWAPDQPPSEEALLALQKEASIMAGLRHPNCVQYLGCCLDPPALVMEYCSRRSVDKILAEANRDAKSSRQIDWVHLLGIATDAAKGMLYLHSRSPPIIHRDLKSPNLLVDALWHVKISDFNLSRALEKDSFSSSLQITNPRWLAPEILRGEHGGKAADVYSFGIVLWELMTWKLPWGENTNPFSIINSVLQGKELVIPEQAELPAGPLSCYDEYVALIKQCWALDPAQRPTMDGIVQQLRSMLSDLIKDQITKNTNSDSSD
eukprot:CAMPEP_0118799260 /NCGR_PEP_ID=MMETSP1161-20130426/1539_1 /TAXON_ID=249345 /ORGANISM="Picochlorum oklahomensis, Strain CCMP2329" /LENGTH=1158 /DNA_ID=CAMNT_0006726935 /DNA_START=401 /DNA_END=3877 /DNA_ORIENTATION=+